MFYFADERDQNRDQNGGSEVESDKVSLQFLKEHESEDAVYNVYLKKCTFNALANELSDGVDGGAYVNFRTKEIRVLKAGSLERIVDALAPEGGELDSMLVRTFLSTYRSFASAKDVASMLVQRHRKLSECAAGASGIGDGPPPKAPVLSVIFIWLDLYPEDFDEPPDYTCLHLLDDFLQLLCAASPSSTQAADLRGTVVHMLAGLSGGCGGSPAHNGFADGGEGGSRSEGSNGNCIARRSSHRSSLRGSSSSLPRQRLSSGGDSMFPFGEELMSPRSLPDEESKRSCRFITNFTQLSAEIVAQQLTLMDADLFVNVRLYQCLGSMWNRSGSSRNRNINCSTVVATVEQFNNVIHRVMATVLKDIDLKHSKRAKVIEKWIQVAGQLRSLKNFSSLRAVVSGLQSGAVYRLQKTWRRVGKEYRTAYEELSQIFSEDNNHVASRELLNKEGTAKMATTSGHDKQIAKRGSMLMRTASKLFNLKSTSADQHHQGASMCFGTVPYLGTFLTDLAMIDAALNDYTDAGLINFDKRRREFDILAQIQLYQSSAKLYNLEPDTDFLAWFRSCRTYSESESFELSYAIEPLHTPTPTSTSTKGRVSRNNSSSFFYSLTSLTSLGDDDVVSSLDSSSASSECAGMPLALLSPSALSSSMQSKAAAPAAAAGPARRQSSQSSDSSSGDLDAIATAVSADQCLVRVHLEASPSNKIPVSADSYKTILLTNKARAHNLIKTTLEKFHADPEESTRYCLVQLLDKKKELQIPDDANVFYAMDNTQILSVFVVREKPRLPLVAAALPEATAGSTATLLRRANKNATFP